MEVDEMAEQNIDYFGILADEIIIHILSDSALGFSEVCRFGQTCKRLLSVSRDQHIWLKKLLRSFPDLQDVVAERSQNENWQRKCVKLNGVPSTTKTLLHALQKRPLDTEEVSYMYFTPLGSLCQDPMCHHVMDQILRNIITDDTDANKNLTVKWYTRKALRYITHSVLKAAWKQYFQLPPEKQYLEDGAILLARWFQPHINIRTSDIKRQLNEIADTVKEDLAEDHPSAQTYSYEEPDKFPSLTYDQCKQVLESMNRVLFSKLGFCGNTQDYYHENNSNINKVLETKFGIPITLSILYQSIARRLGVSVQPVNFLGHFLLSFDATPLGYSEHKIYIDAFHNGKQRSPRECRQLVDLDIIQDRFFSPCSTKEVLIGMLSNCMRQAQEHCGDRMLSAWELMLQVNPGDLDALIMLAKFYIHMEVNLEEILDQLNEVTVTNNIMYANRLSFLKDRAHEMCKQQKEEAQRQDGRLFQAYCCPNLKCVHLSPAFFRDRAHEMCQQQQEEAQWQDFPEKKRANNPEIKYSVGLVMRHRRYNYNCVIYGWDPKCYHSEEWKHQMGVYRLPDKDQQPFYNVFVDDGTNRYAAEESLQYHTAPTTAIPHRDVGKCFHEFNGQYYEMNDGMKMKYSDDEEATKNKYEQQYETDSSVSTLDKTVGML